LPSVLTALIRSYLRSIKEVDESSAVGFMGQRLKVDLSEK
jgi:hypothetical protein